MDIVHIIQIVLPKLYFLLAKVLKGTNAVTLELSYVLQGLGMQLSLLLVTQGTLCFNHQPRLALYG